MAWLLTRPFIFFFVTNLTRRTIGLPIAVYLGVLRHAVGGCVLMALAVLAVRQMLVHAPLAIQVALACGSGCLVYLGYQLLLNREAMREGLDVVRARRAWSSPAVGSSSEATA